VRGLRGAERRADDGALDLAKGAPRRTARFERFFGGDEVTGSGALEIVRLHPADPHVAVTEQPPLHALLADQVALRAGSLPARRPHALGAALRTPGVVIGADVRGAFLGVDERSARRWLDAVIARAFARAIFAAGNWCVGIRP
jgi:hypothetical protein